MRTTTGPEATLTDRLRGSAKRVGALARAEALLLRRNPIALLNALGTPLLGVALLNAFPPDGAPLPGAGIAATLAAFALLFPLYYNLVTTLVARREELVLKRLRSGEPGDREILLGTAAPAVAITWWQCIIGVIAAMVLAGMGAPVYSRSRGGRGGAGHGGVRAARRGQHRDDPLGGDGAAVHPAGRVDLDGCRWPVSRRHTARTGAMGCSGAAPDPGGRPAVAGFHRRDQGRHHGG